MRAKTPQQLERAVQKLFATANQPSTKPIMTRGISIALSLTWVLGVSQVSATVTILETTSEISTLINKGTDYGD